MGMSASSSSSSSPAMQQPPIPPPPPPPHPSAAEEPMVKKKRGRPRKYVPENEGCDLELSPMQSLQKPKISSPLSDPNAPKRARGRPPGTGRKQRLANLGELSCSLIRVASEL